MHYELSLRPHALVVELKAAYTSSLRPHTHTQVA
jgi:hypothetical protein